MKKKVFIYGASFENNLGGPSILYGLEHLGSKYSDKYKAIYFSTEIPTTQALPGFKFIKECRHLSKYTPLLKAFLKHVFSFGRATAKNSDLAELIKSDIIIDAWGLAFCDRMKKGKGWWWLFFKQLLTRCPIEFIARLYGKRVVAFTKSFGPVMTTSTWLSLYWYAHFLCNLVICREQQSYDAFPESCRKRLMLAPDTGLLMPMSECDLQGYLPKDDNAPKTIIVSLSYRSESMWTSTEISYLQTLKEMIAYLHGKYNFRVLLLPNDCFDEFPRDDRSVCQDVAQLLGKPDYLQIVDFRKFTAPEIKYLISKCYLTIASRYHTAVASLSAGTPTFVISWHHKYLELLRLFHLETSIQQEQSLAALKISLDKMDKMILDHDAIVLQQKQAMVGITEKVTNCFDKALESLNK